MAFPTDRPRRLSRTDAPGAWCPRSAPWFWALTWDRLILLDEAKQEALEADLLAVWSQYSRGDEHHTIVENEYLEVHVRPQ